MEHYSQSDKPRQRRYYHDLGRGHDYLLRCKDCRRLITFDRIQKGGGCPKCGNRRVIEVDTLGFWEMVRIRLGLIRFPDRSLFLKEFPLWPKRSL